MRQEVLRRPSPEAPLSAPRARMERTEAEPETASEPQARTEPEREIQ